MLDAGAAVGHRVGVAREAESQIEVASNSASIGVHHHENVGAEEVVVLCPFFAEFAVGAQSRPFRVGGSAQAVIEIHRGTLRQRFGLLRSWLIPLLNGNSLVFLACPRVSLSWLAEGRCERYGEKKRRPHNRMCRHVGHGITTPLRS